MSNEKQPSVVVRPAEALDAVNVVKLLRNEWQELGKEGAPPVDEQKALEWVTLVIREHFVLVADLGGRIVGSIALKPLEWPWARGIFMGQLWFYVFPTFRKGDIAARLKVAAEGILDRNQLLGLFRVELAGSLPPIFDRAPGYRRTGVSYVRIPDLLPEERSA